MTINEIAERLTSLCREGDFETAQKELYAADVVSIEPEAGGGFEKESHGLDAIIEKGKKWYSMVSVVHEIEVSEPVVARHSFAVTMRINSTMKDKKRMDMSELCVYHVKDGKIISEQFFM